MTSGGTRGHIQLVFNFVSENCRKVCKLGHQLSKHVAASLASWLSKVNLNECYEKLCIGVYTSGLAVKEVSIKLVSS